MKTRDGMQFGKEIYKEEEIKGKVMISCLR
jgi:hypothetical protein